MKKILVTGAAGFIGSFLVKALLENDFDVVGLDNLNDYYDINLKYGRLKSLCGIERDDVKEHDFCVGSLYPRLRFVKADITDREYIASLFKEEHFDIVCNLAAQAGVRYSIINPFAYAESNLLGFLNILEACRNNSVSHLIYASSSSVYGMKDKVPFSETDPTDHPVSLYAATKKANEVMAHSYSYLYHLPTTGLRFFTVYGPWGRPDMAPFMFIDSIIKGDPIRVFNNGMMKRDFTYIGDIIKAVVRIVDTYPHANEDVPYHIYNIGHSEPVVLSDFIHSIERTTEKQAVCNYESMQPGDVLCTYADTSRLMRDYNVMPDTDIDHGVESTYNWYKEWVS